MRIGVTYDLRADHLADGMSEEETAEFDSEETIAAICEALSCLGHTPMRIGHVKALAQRLVAGERWDGVFNICEGVAGYAREAQVPALLETYGVPYVFSDPLTLALTLDKAWTKRVVRDCGVPTADFALVESEKELAGITLPFPLFCKPVAEGSGKGIGARSLVTNKAELGDIARDLLMRFRQPVLVETFLPGREFTIGITGTGADAEVMGVMEIVPVTKEGEAYGYDTKSDWEGKIKLALAGDEEAREAGRVALAAWRALRCRDGGRVDAKSDTSGNPLFIEVNPLAGLRPGYSDLCFLADFTGLGYQGLIAKIMDSFSKRAGL
jgi:D-alanine-D-alanine ligase